MDPQAVTQVILRQDCFGRWIVVNANEQELAWSGSEWVEIDEADGLPTANVQVSNCDSRAHAQEYAEQFGFAVIVE